MSTITVSAGPAGMSGRLWPGAPGRDRLFGVPSSSVGARAAAYATVSRPGARLTRRGRLMLTLLCLVLLVSAGVLATGGRSAVAGSERGAVATAELVTVAPGETLWEIAERAAPGVDPRETIERIIDLNALESSAVAAGSVLLLPAG